MQKNEIDINWLIENEFSSNFERHCYKNEIEFKDEILRSKK